MDSLRLSLLLVCLLFFNSGCADKLGYEQKLNNQNFVATAGEGLAGVFVNVDGGEVNLDKPSLKPRILIFAQDTCLVCAHEAESFAEYLRGVPQSSLNVQIITVVQGATVDDAIWWRDIHEVSWLVTVEPSGERFKYYCPQGEVPCLVIELPNKGIVKQHIGEFGYKAIEEITGKWY